MDPELSSLSSTAPPLHPLPPPRHHLLLLRLSLPTTPLQPDLGEGEGLEGRRWGGVGRCFDLPAIRRLERLAIRRLEPPANRRLDPPAHHRLEMVCRCQALFPARSTAARSWEMWEEARAHCRC